jgi:hypothetical protein
MPFIELARRDGVALATPDGELATAARGGNILLLGSS